MGKLTIIGMIWLLLFAVTLILIDGQLSVNESDQTSNDAQKHEPQDSGTIGFVGLQVNGSLTDDFWERGINDLPVLTVVINYIVENVGNSSANVVTIDIALDSVYYSTETIYNLLPNYGFRDSISFSIDYDQSKTVEIDASCENVTVSWSYMIDAELPRQPYWALSKLFITPDEDCVEETYKKIISDPFLPFIPHWMTIRNWVGENIGYINDYDSHNESEFWQLGKETLESRTGDCEDFAILLCSLLRTDGWKVEDVYVVIGQNEAGDYHAWVKMKIPLTPFWYNIEPTQGGWYTGPGDILVLSGYTPIYNFNDQYFIIL